MRIELLYVLCILTLIAHNKTAYPLVDQKKIILSHYAVYGILPVSKNCTDAASISSESGRFKTDRTFMSGLFSAVTLGVYTPNKEFVTSDELL